MHVILFSTHTHTHTHVCLRTLKRRMRTPWYYILPYCTLLHTLYTVEKSEEGREERERERERESPHGSPHPVLCQFYLFFFLSSFHFHLLYLLCATIQGRIDRISATKGHVFDCFGSSTPRRLGYTLRCSPRVPFLLLSSLYSVSSVRIEFFSGHAAHSRLSNVVDVQRRPEWVNWSE